ncbi:hypothetical protein HHX47_DHR5000723 [Lentinula edodes]|nr:hypothetical protein HHX47_DHR5000723 [Lentinula edodes]
MAAANLSEQLDNAWTRRVQQANEWNMKLELGKIAPGALRRILWFVKALASSDPRSRRQSLEVHWRKVGGKRNASLAWSLNEVFGHLFWVGGAFKFFWRSMTTGVLARGALTNSVYKRSVVLTGRARIEYTNAKLVNSISTDVSV